MKGYQKKILTFLQGQKQQLIVPVYQREYSWQKKQCEKLLSDIIALMNDNKIQSHFLGTIVYETEGVQQISKVTTMNLIDGQQRITSISLLLLALYYNIKRIKEDSDIKINEQKLKEQNLINKYEEGLDWVKLLLTKKDRVLYEKILKNQFNDIYKSKENIVQNFIFFYKQIEKQNLDLEKLYDSLHKIMIVEIQLDKDKDNAQLIFESLNSAGKKLTQVDLIRNNMLMNLNNNIQNEFYNEYWKNIQFNVGENICDFTRQYLIMKKCQVVNEKDVYEEFKQYRISNTTNNLIEDTENLFLDLLHFSYIYNMIKTSTHENPYIQKMLQSFNLFEITTINPLLMFLLHLNSNKRLEDRDLIVSLQLIESYLIRRFICNLPTNGLNQYVTILLRKLQDSETVKNLRYEFYIAKGTHIFPKDDYFRDCFTKSDFYNLPNNIKKYIILSIENYNRKEKITGVNLEINRVLPLDLNSYWTEILGTEHENIHKTIVNTIGNTLITNKQYPFSNINFQSIKDYMQELSINTLNVNRYIFTCNIWSNINIHNNSLVLYNIANQIWKEPKDIGGEY